MDIEDIEKELLGVIKKRQFTSIDEIKLSINDLQQKIQSLLMQKIEIESCFSREQKNNYKNFVKLWKPDISWKWWKIVAEGEDESVKRYYEIELLTTSENIVDMLSSYIHKLKSMQDIKYQKVQESVLLSALSSVSNLLKSEYHNAMIDIITKYYDVKAMDYDDDHVYCFEVSQGNISDPVTTIKAIVGFDGRCLVKGTYVIPLIRKES